MNKKNILILFILCIILLGCTKLSTLDPHVDQTQKMKTQGYPIDESKDTVGYPISQSMTDFPSGPEFNIVEPVKEGEMTVTGTGPSGVPIILVDVTEVGEVLGETIIHSDGTFSFKLDVPLKKNHVVGLQLGDISATEFSENEFFYSETYYVRPMIGILFDITTVQ